MAFYEGAAAPVREDLRDAHETVFAELASPGTWWTGVERLAIAASARRARIEAGLAEGEPAGLPEADLPPAAREVAAVVGAAPETLHRGQFEAWVPSGLAEAAYVEAIGVIARSVAVDTFCRGAGVPLHPYPEARPGEPTREIPTALARDAGWVAMIPEGTPEGDALYGGPTVNVVRALSQVPEEVRAWIRVAGTQYVHLDFIQDMGAPTDRAIDRTQIELVAGRVSALNECFY